MALVVTLLDRGVEVGVGVRWWLIACILYADMSLYQQVYVL